jgi:hypothetical protein
MRNGERLPLSCDLPCSIAVGLPRAEPIITTW